MGASKSKPAVEEDPRDHPERLDLDSLPGIVYNCDSCGRLILPDDPRWYCWDCIDSQDSYDWCEQCHKTKTHEHAMRLAPKSSLAKMDFQGGMVDLTSVEILHRAFKSYATLPLYGILNKNSQQLEWLSYEEVYFRSLNLAAALQELFPSLRRDSRNFIAIAAENRLGWMICDYACMFAALPTSPIHLGLDTSAAAYILERTEATSVITSNKSFKTFRAVFDNFGTYCVKMVIFMDKNVSDDILAYLSSKNLAPFTVPALIDRGAQLKLKEIKLNPDDIITLMFTSDMPLAHAMERESDWLCVVNGGRIAIFEPDGDSMSGLFDFVRLVRPSLFAAVPAVWNILYSKFTEAVELEKLKRASAESPLDEQDAEAIENQLMKTQFATVLGDRIRAIECGGAPVGEKVRLFLVKTFANCMYREGYGATESGGIGSGFTSTVSTRAEVSYRLKDVPELGYFSEDRPFPRGELWVKSADTAPGYFKDPENTSSSFDADGYFCTGDIVEMDPEKNTIRIIDRRKHFFKLAQGEYVAPERLEKIYSTSKYVREIYIYAESVESYVLAVIVPRMAVLEAWAQSAGLKFDSFEELCEMDECKAEILASLSKIAADAANSIHPFEMPRGIVLEPEPFTAENGLLTSTFKLKRLNLQHKYKARMRQLYDEKNAEMTRARIELMRKQILEMVNSSVGHVSDQASISNSSAPNLVELGLDSLSAIRLSNLIKSEFHIAVSAEKLISEQVSLDSLLSMLSTATGNTAAPSVDSDSKSDISSLYKPQVEVEWAKEIELDAEIRDSLSLLPSLDLEKNPLEFNKVFLTGASGFFGVFLLQEILTKTTANVVCLVRTTPNASAQERLQNWMQRMLVDMGKDDIVEYFVSNRIQVVSGDLEEPHFGLGEQAWNDLCSTVDLIIHNGCKVNAVFSYDALKAANVTGTVTALRMASTHRRKPFMFISSLSAIGSSMSENEVVDEDLDEIALQVMGGYGCTKHISEILVRRAHEAGLPTMIIRPGTIGSHSVTGASNLRDFHARFIVGVVQLGAAPASEAPLDMIPVDHVAKFTIGLLRKNLGWGLVFHVYEQDNAPTVSKVAQRVAAEFPGTEIGVNYREWVARLQQAATSEVANALYPLMGYFSGSQFPTGHNIYSRSKYHMYLQLIGMKPVTKAELDESYLDKMLNFIQSAGLFPKTASTNV